MATGLFIILLFVEIIILSARSKKDTVLMIRV
jgi:hypothetical protein